jgi:hypothetical protein
MNAAEAMLSKLWSDIQAEQNSYEAERAKENPVKYKKTRVFPADARMSYRFYREKNGRGQEVRYCWSTERNAPATSSAGVRCAANRPASAICGARQNSGRL